MSARRFLPALACLAALAPLSAQHTTHLSGLILDASGATVPGALVSVVSEETGFRRATQSQPDGGYIVASLEPGVYKVTVRKEGFRAVVRFGVRLEVSQAARVDFTLALGSMQEVIVVEGAAPPLNSEDASLGAQVAREEIERLPLNGRGLLSLLELAPGTIVTPATRGEAGQFTANGQRPNTHYFTVDGVSANTGVSGGGLPAQSTGGALPGMTAFGSLHSLISLEALQEFRVQTSTAAPEFGRLPGAQVSLSSRSGSNQLHASLLYYFRHERLDANDWFANRHGDGRAPLRVNDFGGTLGGPIRRNRTFFFLSYEGMRLRQPFAWRSPVPSLSARESAPDWVQLLLNLFPAPNGPELGPDLAEWTGRNHRPSRLEVGSLRLDHAVTSRITAFGRYNDSPSTSEFGSTQVSLLNLRSRGLTFGLNLRVRPEVILDLRMNASSASADSLWSQNNPRAYPACYLEPVTSHLLGLQGACDYLLRFSIAGVGQLTWGREGKRAQAQLQILQTASLNRGAHSVRLGADYRRLAPTRQDATATLSVIAESLEDLSAGRNLWIANSGPQAAVTVLKETSLFAQDTWRAAPRLTATYGLRWEFSSASLPSQPAYYLDPLEGYAVTARRSLWPPAHRNFAPRVGLAYRPTAEGRTVVRAGVGLYYDSSLSFATDQINGGPFNLWQYGNPKYAPFPMLLSYGFMPDLRLPFVLHSSVSVQHAFGDREVVSVGYVGAVGHRLVRREMGGPGSTELVWLALATNHGSSGYHGLQLQYRRRLARNFQALLSYAWSHSIDDSSSDSVLYWAGSGLHRASDRGSSDFDVRQALTAAFTYEIRSSPPVTRLTRFLRNWAMDGMFRARTGFPINVLDAEFFRGVSFANAFRPDLAAGQPVWITDHSAPGGTRLNRAAFQAAPDSVQGGLGRNAISGLGMSQLDLALRREFSVGGQRFLQLRLEAFNALNQANFADPVRFLVSPLFGHSTSTLNLMLGTGSPGSGLAPMFQTGGARSLQVALRFRF